MTTTNRFSETQRTPEVWDLTDTSAYPVPRVRTLEPAPSPGPLGAIAAAAGVLALGSAVLPGPPATARWAALIVFGLAALVLGFAALRRSQILLTVLLAVGAAAGPVLGAALILLLPQTAPPIENVVLPAGSPFSHSSTVVTTPALDARPAAEAVTASDAAAALAVHLRAMHGMAGPFPLALDSTTGALVERGGVIGDVQVGVVPQGMHVVYSIAPDQRFFEVRVELDDDHAAAATADSTLDPSDAG